MHRTKTGRLKPFLSLKSIGLLLLFLLTFRMVALADNVVNGFSASQTIQPGMVVAIDKAASQTVKPAPANNSNLIYGVAVDPSDAPFALVGQNSKVFVATTGTYPVLVSASGGSIKTGDYISMSNINGIAGKAQPGQTEVLGKAESSFNGSTNAISGSGSSAIGKVFVNIAVAKNPIASTDPSVPEALRKITSSIANKNVPVIRVYIALFVFLLSLVASVVILWSGVNSSLVSIGRNPLSRKAIFRAMYKVVFTGLGVLVIGIAGVYLLLKV